jgi:hypothetical protein
MIRRSLFTFTAALGVAALAATGFVQRGIAHDETQSLSVALHAARQPLAASGASQAAVAVPVATQPHVEFLASPELEGRATGSAGADRAAAYLVEQLRSMGAEPLPGRDDFLLPFDYTAGVTDGGTSLELTRGDAVERWDTPDAVQALSFSDSTDAAGPVVFAGYGLVVPESAGFGYDSYATLDVTDKVVVVLRYFPEDAPADARAALARYSGLRYKAMAARERGAKALVVVTGPRSPNAGRVVPLAFDTASAGSGLVAASVSGDVARSLFIGRDQSLEEIQRSLDTGNPHVAGFALPGFTLRVSARVSRDTKTTHNVVGYLPATARIALPKPYVAIGAHYDHLGRGSQGSSLARAEEADAPHLGADDNASGVAAVLEAARVLSGLQRPRAIIVAFWSGEEMGLLGSSAFVAAPPVAIDAISAYVNADMVGRMRDNKLIVQATGSSPDWPRLLEQANIAAGFDLQRQDDPYLPTDSASFNLAGVPTLNFFTGGHEDYHRPGDMASLINYEDLDRVAEMLADVITRIARQSDAPAFTKVEPRAQPSGSRDTVRVFTGTIPDYATDIEGLLLGGVVGGGPAEAAGLQKGDVIVQIGERTITNIYDYTYALDTLKPDVPVTLTYTRNGERRETTLTPRVRR